MLTVTITVADGNDGTGGAETPARTSISDTEFELLHKLVGYTRLEMGKLLDDDPMVEVEIRTTIETLWGGGAKAELKPGPGRAKPARAAVPSQVFLLASATPQRSMDRVPRPIQGWMNDEEPF
jgi:hypothetical protein